MSLTPPRTHHNKETTVTTVIDHTVEREAWPSFRVGTSAIEVIPMTAGIGAELRNVSLAEVLRRMAGTSNGTR